VTTPVGPASAVTDQELAALLARIGDDVAPPAAVSTPTKPADAVRPERADVAQVVSDGGLAFDPHLATFGARLGGLLIDAAAVLLFMLPGLGLVVAGSTPLIVLGVVAMMFGFGTATALSARAVSTNGQWIGNRMTGTKVVDVRNGRTVTTGEAGLRFVVRFCVSSIFGIGFLMALGNSQRQTLHDRIAGTVVTGRPRATWSIDDEGTDA
jgi:uncharacterized RDD family membrane protein YckC